MVVVVVVAVVVGGLEQGLTNLARQTMTFIAHNQGRGTSGRRPIQVVDRRGGHGAGTVGDWIRIIIIMMMIIIIMMIGSSSSNSWRFLQHGGGNDTRTVQFIL